MRPDSFYKTLSELSELWCEHVENIQRRQKKQLNSTGKHSGLSQQPSRIFQNFKNVNFLAEVLWGWEGAFEDTNTETERKRVKMSSCELCVKEVKQHPESLWTLTPEGALHIKRQRRNVVIGQDGGQTERETGNSVMVNMHHETQLLWVTNSDNCIYTVYILCIYCIYTVYILYTYCVFQWVEEQMHI